MASRRRVPSATFDATTVVLDEPDWRHFEQPELSPILRGALDAFYESGFRGTTVRDISQRVGVTMPTLYYHHGNKEGIFTALLECATKDVLARAYTARDDGGNDPARRLSNVVESMILRTFAFPRLVTLEADVRYLSTPNRDRFETVRTEVEGLVRGIIREGNRRALFSTSDPIVTARALLAMCDDLQCWYENCPPKPRAVARKYGAIALKTVGFRAGT